MSLKAVCHAHLYKKYLDTYLAVGSPSYPHTLSSRYTCCGSAIRRPFGSHGQAFRIERCLQMLNQPRFVPLLFDACTGYCHSLSCKQVIDCDAPNLCLSLCLLTQVASCAVQGYKEGELTFPPTYKFDPGTDVYDSSGKSRVPSWCDRVLWRCNTDAVELLQYTHVPQLKVSDHR